LSLGFRGFAVSPANLAPFRASRGFLDSEPMRQVSKVARRALPEDQLAPVSPVLHVARGIFDDRDLFFQDRPSRG